MRISTIQCYETPRTVSKQKCVHNHQGLKTNPELEPAQDTVTFKSYTAKGAGIGAAAGVACFALICAASGGLATPLGLGLYTAAMATSGGMLGHVADKVNEDDKNNKNNKKP